MADAGGVAVRRAFDEGTRERLDDGGTVLLVLLHDGRSHSVEGAFSPCFWSYALFERTAPPGTMGAAFDPGDPLFESFPTEGHADWQWWPVLDASRPVVLDDAPGEYAPTVSAVDNIERNRKLGLVFGTACGEGRLLVRASDLFAAADRPSTRAFYAALLSYADSEAFDPDRAFGRELLDKLLPG